MRIDMLGARNIPAVHSGVERVVEELGSALVARGHRVTTVVDRRSVTQADHRGLTVHGVPCIRTKHLHAITQVAASLPWVLRDRPDVVHVHALGPGMVSPVTRAAGQPTVLTVHSMDWQRAKWGPAARALFRTGSAAAVRGAHLLTAVSRALCRTVEAHYGVPVRYIPNGVHVVEPEPPGETLRRFGLQPGRYLLFVGRLVPEKGVHVLLDAYRSVAPADPLVVVGDAAGSYAADYGDRLTRAAGPGVVFTGYQSGRALTELYSNARCYVLPSLLEGAPLGLLEALSFGLPVVHTDLAECTEVTDGLSALTVPPQDAAALATALRAVLTDDALVARLRAHGREQVRARYTWTAVAAETERAYSDLLAQRGRAATS